MTRKEKRDLKNARHRKNEERRGLRRIVNRCLSYTWNWSYVAQNQEAMEWLNWDQK
jgi:hypothetical protein